jgi:hypothetical protein
MEVMALRVMVRGAGLPTAVLIDGDTLVFGRAPGALPDTGPGQPRYGSLTLPQCAPHVSRVLADLAVDRGTARLRWRGGTAAQLASLFAAPGGARRVTLSPGMSVTLDEGENQLTVLRGRLADGAYRDLLLIIEVAVSGQPDVRPHARANDREAVDTSPAPGLAPGSREWYVALALAEPWLSGADAYPRPPSNREIYERVLAWHGSAWNLDRPQRVDDVIKLIAGVAFGPRDNPFATEAGRAQNIRYAVGRRTAEVGLVTADDLDRMDRAARERTR